ncbi:MAG: GTPase, partial [archaeon]|nr:GTPase [archaeon]
LINRKYLEVAFDTVMKQRRVEKDFVVYFTNRKKNTVRNLLANIKQIFGKYGKRESYAKNPILEKPYREAKGDIIVGVVGYPNVGKSSVINAIAFKKKAPVSSKAGTTHGIHWITAGNVRQIKLIDTPGVIPLKHNEETSLGLIAARNPEKMKDPETVAGKIIEMFVKKGRLDKLEKYYNFKTKEEIKADGKDANPYLILEQISFARNHLKKGGVADEKRTAINIVKEWQTGKIKL